MSAQGFREEGINPAVGKAFVVGEEDMTNEVICFFLANKVGMECLKGTMRDLLAIFSAKEEDKPNVVLFDYDASGISEKQPNEAHEIIKRLGSVPAILFNFNPEERIKKWVAAGIRGILYRSDPSQNMVKAINIVMQGKIWIPKQVTYWGIDDQYYNQGAMGGAMNSLTKREKEILSFVAEGSTNLEVASRLFISPHTVKVHIQNIYKKIGVPNRVKATIWANNNLNASC